MTDEIRAHIWLASTASTQGDLHLGQGSFRGLHCFWTVAIVSFDFTGNTKRVIAYSPKYPERIILIKKRWDYCNMGEHHLNSSHYITGYV